MPKDIEASCREHLYRVLPVGVRVNGYHSVQRRIQQWHHNQQILLSDGVERYTLLKYYLLHQRIDNSGDATGGIAGQRLLARREEQCSCLVCSRLSRQTHCVVAGQQMSPGCWGVWHLCEGGGCTSCQLRCSSRCRIASSLGVTAIKQQGSFVSFCSNGT